MNGTRHWKWNLMQKNAMHWKWKRVQWDLHGQNILSIEKEEKDLGVVLQNNLSPEKHIEKIFADIFIMPRNILMLFTF